MSDSDYAESDENPLRRYRRLLVSLEMSRRAAAGGVLTAAEEARRVDEIERVWWAMTDAERDEYERDIGRTIAKIWRHRKVVHLPPNPPRERGLRGWLRGCVILPRWLVLAWWAAHCALMFWLGRIV